MGFSFTTFERVSSRREKKGKEGGKDKEKSAQEKKKTPVVCILFTFVTYSTDTINETVVKHWFNVDLTTGLFMQRATHMLLIKQARLQISR